MTLANFSEVRAMTVLGEDGFYHPANEEEIIVLVKTAQAEGLQIRCRGSAHSIAWAIYTDPGKGNPHIPNKVSIEYPPAGPNMNLMLDRYVGLMWIDERQGIVEVEAGIHLGTDPSDPNGTSGLENSLLYQAFQKGWTVRELGGITHQTLGGYLSTGSAGGSLIHDFDENIMALRVIDGTGHAEWIDKERDQDLFNAMRVSLGLLGIISKVRLQLTPSFHITGQEFTESVNLEECGLDFFGPGRDNKPSLREFLLKTPYSRILWWPQKGLERITVWQAATAEGLRIVSPTPYRQFADTTFLTQLKQLGGAVLFTLLGRSPGFLKTLLTWLYPTILGGLVPITKPGKAQTFVDYVWRSLPMDNEASDVLLGTEFTEIFVPLSHSERVLQLLRGHFNGGFKTTGYYAIELYAGRRNKSWLSPSFREDMLRVDVFWYIRNEGDPASENGFFRQFWDLLRNSDIPLRLHWGKFLPEYDFEDWAAYLKSQYPRWDEFMNLRMQRDPNNIFLTDYWRRHLLG